MALPSPIASTRAQAGTLSRVAPGTSTFTSVNYEMDFSELVTKREIVFHTADLGDGDLGVLSEVLEKTKVLESLNLSVNRLRLEDGSFATALSRNATLKELFLNSNKIGSEGAWWLGKALTSNTTLERLSLDGNKLGDASADHISDLLVANDTLEHLSLGANRIGEKGAKRLAAALKENKGLESFSVRGNKIGGAASDFVAALEANGTISALHVGSARDSAQQRLDKLLASPERKIRTLEARLARKDALLKELAKKDAEIAERDALISKRDEAMVNMGRDIAAKDEELLKRDAEITRMDQVIVNMGRDIESREMYINSSSDEKVKKLEDELVSLRTQMTMYVNSFEDPDESALKRKEDELETLRTHTNIYVNSFEDPIEPQQAGTGVKGRSTSLYKDVLEALSDCAGQVDMDEDLRTLNLYTGMMLGLSDGKKQKAEVEQKNEDLVSMALHMSIMMGLSDRRAAPTAEDCPKGPAADVPAGDEGCFETKDMECHIGDPSIESDSPVTHVSHERWTKEGLAVVVVGASGDLAKKKTYPSLLSLYAGGLLPEDLAVYGFARSDMSDKELRDRIRPYLAEKNDTRLVEEFLGRCFYQAGAGYGDGGAWEELDGKLRAREGEADGKWNRLFYFAIPPDVFAETGEAIKANCMASDGFSRMIVEKPFGRDLESCRHILHQLGQHFDETNLFRIDHYLGKEMTQNLMVMRFGNVWMEQMWNRDHVQCIMLTFKEPFGTEGRGGYFDKYGIIRDIIQNHLLQVMCLLCMESPNKLDGEGAGEKIRDEKVRVIEAMQEVTLDDVFLGQYAGYSNDPTISNKDTNCPTFAMVCCFINNPRWAGVPIIFKAGKALNERKAEMRVQFKDAPAAAALFGADVPRNEVVVKLQPEESIYMKSNIKTPGFSSAPIQSELEVKYDTRYFGDGTTTNPDAYSRLILDVLRGRSANFVRSDELIRAWEIFTPVLHQIEKENILPHIYKPGSRGPATADAWFKEKSGYVRNEAYAYIDGKVSKKQLTSG